MQILKFGKRQTQKIYTERKNDKNQIHRSFRAKLSKENNPLLGSRSTAQKDSKHAGAFFQLLTKFYFLVHNLIPNLSDSCKPNQNVINIGIFIKYVGR